MVTFRAAPRGDSADPCAGGRFVVELQSEGLHVTRTVLMFDFDWHSLCLHFADLADLWKGGDGTKGWRSVEHDLGLEAVSHHLCHCDLAFTVQDGPTPTWFTRLGGVMTDAGEDLRNLAGDVLE